MEGNTEPILPVDFHAGIFSSLFNDVRFCTWKQTHRRWQLHISGGPGSGKSTLARRIARLLQVENTIPVTLLHIYVADGLDGTDTILREHFSHPHTKSLLEIDLTHAPLQDVDFDKCYAFLIDRFSTSEAGYLIVDGFDNLGIAIQDQLLRKLAIFEKQALRVLLLRGAPELRPFSSQYTSCDTCIPKAGGPEELYVYWSCDICEFDICDDCRSNGQHCRDQSHRMTEPYQSINIELRSLPSELHDFVRLDLIREYGDDVDDNIVKVLCERCEGNINYAKLRLDHIRDLENPRDYVSISDRLPRSVVAFFDAEMHRLNTENSLQRYQTLLALAIVAEVKRAKIWELEDLLRYTEPHVTSYETRDYPLVRRVLRSAKGILCAIVCHGQLEPGEVDSDRQKIALYLDDIDWYIAEDYNKELALIKRFLYQYLDGTEGVNRLEEYEHTTGADRKATMGTDVLRRLTPDCNIAEAIARDPGSLCNLCQGIIHRGSESSGVIVSTAITRQTACSICLHVLKAAETLKEASVKFKWSRRTRGRLLQSDDQLTLTLRLADLPFRHFDTTFVFVLKSEIGFVQNERNIGMSTELLHTGAQIQQWLQTCQNEHYHCTIPKSKDYVPKRLVDMDTGVKGQLRIIYGTEKHEGPYATLSHSWGRSPRFLTLTTSNQQKLMTEGFSMADMANKNFEDAIQVAQYLGVRYIWIDSLCICQAGKDKDFSTEGQFMHLVYQHSYFNIVAADSKDGDGGLFRPRLPDTSLSMNTTQQWVMLDKDMWARKLLNNPIYARGWVFQERMLSPRLIHFAQSEVFWDCCTISACESLPRGIPFALSATATKDRRWRSRLQRHNSGEKAPESAAEDSLETFWESSILNYTSCELTNQADKTLAIWSVAKLVRDQLQLEDEYGCGLWANALHEQLAWRVKATKKDARMDTLQALFPSWSWASVNGPIQVQHRLVGKRCYAIRSHEKQHIVFGDFVEKAIQRDLQPQFAASNALAIYGHLVPGYLRLPDQPGGLHRFEYASNVACGGYDSFDVVLDEAPTMALLETQRLYFLPLIATKTDGTASAYSGTGLILATSSDVRDITRSRCRKRILELATLYRSRPTEQTGLEDWEWEVRRLRVCIQALNSWLFQVAMWDQALPARLDMVYCRLGVVKFDDLPVGAWNEIRDTGEKCFWLD